MWYRCLIARGPVHTAAIAAFALVLFVVVAWFTIAPAGVSPEQPPFSDHGIDATGLSCGPAALLVVSRAHDAEAALRLAAILQRDGLANAPVTSFYDLAASARRAGFDPIGLNVNARHLHELPLPVLVHVKPDHFLALMSITDDSAVAVDQGALTRTIPRRDFDTRFSGYVLCFRSSQIC